MLVTRSDPRHTWQQLADPELAALPAGAKEAPLDWVCTVHVEERGYFDKDAQEEVSYPYRTARDWKTPWDPKLARAGALSFHGVDDVGVGFFLRVPSLPASLTALTVHGHQLSPGSLAALGRAAAWTDVSIWGSRWAPASRKAGLAELKDFRLKGLELYCADVDAADVAGLNVEGVEDLGISGRWVDPTAFATLAAKLGPLKHLDLHDARLGTPAARLLGPKLAACKRLVLSNNEIGDEGFAAVLPAFGAVEDLWVSSCGLTDASLRALVEAAPPKLKGLWIDGNAFTNDAARALVQSTLFGQLEGLSLFQRNALDATLLEGHPLAGCLTGTARLPGVTALWFQGRPG